MKPDTTIFPPDQFRRSGRTTWMLKRACKSLAEHTNTHVVVIMDSAVEADSAEKFIHTNASAGSDLKRCRVITFDSVVSSFSPASGHIVGQHADLVLIDHRVLENRFGFILRANYEYYKCTTKAMLSESNNAEGLSRGIEKLLSKPAPTAPKKLRRDRPFASLGKKNENATKVTVKMNIGIDPAREFSFYTRPVNPLNPFSSDPVSMVPRDYHYKITPVKG